MTSLAAGPRARKTERETQRKPGLAMVRALESECPLCHITLVNVRSPDQIAPFPQQSLFSPSRPISHSPPLNHMPVLLAPRHTPAAVAVMRTDGREHRLSLSHTTIPSQTVQQPVETSFLALRPQTTHHCRCRTRMAPTVFTITTWRMAMHCQATGLVRHPTDSWRDQACPFSATRSRWVLFP